MRFFLKNDVGTGLRIRVVPRSVNAVGRISGPIACCRKDVRESHPHRKHHRF